MTRRRATRDAVTAAVVTTIFGVCFALSYNLYKHVLRVHLQEPFTDEIKAAIRDPMPWSIALFAGAAVLAIAAARRGSVLRVLGVAAAATALLNALCSAFGLHAVIVLDLAVAMTALVGVLSWGTARGLARWRGVVSGTPVAIGGHRTALLATVFAATALGTALCARQLYRQWSNTLYDNGHWHATKTDQERAVLGAVSFLVTRKPLYRDRLDLSTWHGFHEVVLREPVDPEHVAFSLSLDENSYVAFEYGGDAEHLDGVRLSRNAELPSQWFRATVDGFIEEQRPLDASVGAGWHDVELDFATGELRIDGDPAGSWPRRPAPPRVGFRGGKYPVHLDDVAIAQTDGSVWREDFAPRPAGWGVAAVALAAFLAITALAAGLSRRRRSTLVAAIGFGVPLLIGTGLLTVVDYWILARANPPWIDYRGFQTRIETAEQVVARTREELATLGPGPRLVLLGTSQTWGAGARRLDESWAHRLGQLIDGQDSGLPDGEHWRVVNGGICGSESGEVFDAYRREWADPIPHLVLVILGTNDDDAVAYERHLEELVAFNRAAGVTTVFVLEPNAVENPGTHLEANHTAMRRVATATETPLIDMPTLLAPCEQLAFLWWDHVHLSSAGQEFFANILHRELSRLGVLDEAARTRHR